jgi:hypothetical protein
MLQDCLSVLADGTLADAEAVVSALEHLRSWKILQSLWRPAELPVTARNNLAEEHGADKE